MTNENHAEELLDSAKQEENLSLADLMGSDADDEINSEVADAVEQKQDDGEQTKVDGEEKPVEVEKPAVDVSKELKQVRDNYSRVRNAQLSGHRMLKALEEDGHLDRDEMAEKTGLHRKEVDRILDEKPTAAPGEPEYHQVLFQSFDEDVKRPTVLKVLERAYGDVTALNELKASYIWASTVDPSVKAQLDGITPDEIVAHVFDTGKQYLEEYRELQSEGLSPLEKIRQLKAQQLSGNKPEPKPKSDSQPVSKPAASQPTLPAGVPAKETPQQAHLRRLAG